MRIEAYTQVQQMYNAKKAPKSNQTAQTNFSDQLQISSMGKDIHAGKQAVTNSPDVRENLIGPIKKEIQNGTYQVSAESFADRILEKYNEMSSL